MLNSKQIDLLDVQWIDIIFYVLVIQEPKVNDLVEYHGAKVCVLQFTIQISKYYYLSPLSLLGSEHGLYEV